MGWLSSATQEDRGSAERYAANCEGPAAAFALDVVLDAPGILVRLEVAEIILINVPTKSLAISGGRLLRLPSTRPPHRDGCRWKIVAIGAGSDAIKFDEIYAPGGKESTTELMYSCAPGFVKSILSWKGLGGLPAKALPFASGMTTMSCVWYCVLRMG